MANDIATLRPRLSVSLRDSDMEVWGEDELTDLLLTAAAQLYPKVARAISAPIFPLVEEQEDYVLPDGVLEISRVDVARVSDDTLLHHLASGTWEIYGDPFSVDARLFVNRRYSNPDHYYVVHGYGTYDLVVSLPPDQYVPFILASAQAEAIRTMVPKRAAFDKWMKLNQKESMSVNELSQMLSTAEAKAERELARIKTWRKPKPA